MAKLTSKCARPYKPARIQKITALVDVSRRRLTAIPNCLNSRFGLTLRFKRLEVLKELFQTVLLIFGGVFFSVDRMPGWMATIARFLPLTPGVEVLRKTLLDQVTLGTLASDGEAQRRPSPLQVVR